MVCEFCVLFAQESRMSLLKGTLAGVFKGAGKLAKGVGNALNDGFEELEKIPANIAHAQREKLSGEYTVDISKNQYKDTPDSHTHKTATIKLDGGKRTWDILKIDGKEVGPSEDWDSFGYGEWDEEELPYSQYQRNIEVHSTINRWYIDLLKANGIDVNK